MKATEQVATLREKISERLGTRRALSIISLTAGAAVLAFAAILLPSAMNQQVLPPLQPLTAGTYAPAQVVFKIKAGKNPTEVVSKLLTKKQTVYKNTKTGKLVPSSDTSVKAIPKSFTQQTLTLHQKNIQQVFPKVIIADDVKNKILARKDAKDPNVTYDKLGMGQWYVLTTTEVDADVAQMVQQLKSDKGNVESASANGFSTLDSVKTTAPVAGGETGGGESGATATGCTNPNDPYSCTIGYLDDSTGENSAVPNQWDLSAVNVQSAWAITKGSPATIIAIVDSGIDYSHPEFQNRIWLNSLEDINHNGCADYWPSTDFSTHLDCYGKSVNIGGDVDGKDNDGNGYIDDINGMNFDYATATNSLQNNPTQGPTDTTHHGSIVASVAVANTDTVQPYGMAGICPNCTLMPVVAQNSDGVVNTSTTLAAAIRYATNNGADVINMSWYSQQSDNYLISVALEDSAAAGTALVTATGNDDIQLDGSGLQPQTNENVILVGGVQPDKGRWLYTNFLGQKKGSNYGSQIDIMAPSADILGVAARSYSSTLSYDQRPLLDDVTKCIEPIYYHDTCGAVQNLSGTGSNQYFFYDEGTSFAAPIVSGIVGLIKSVNPALSLYDIKQILETTATTMHDVTDESGVLQNFPGTWNQYSGYGLVNAQAAVKQAFDRRPDFSFTSFAAMAGSQPVVDKGSNKLGLDLWVDNAGWTSAKNVPYRIINTDTNTTVYNGFVYYLNGGSGGSLVDTVTVPSGITMPTHVKIVMDPDNRYSEPFETDNTSPIITVLQFGVPYINHVDPPRINYGSTATFTVTASDANTAASDLTISVVESSKPVGSTYNATNKTFSWTPDATQASGIYAPEFMVVDPGGLTSTKAIPIAFNNQSALAISAITSYTTLTYSGVTWTTSRPADKQIDLGTTTEYGTTYYVSESLTSHRWDFATEPGTTYHYKLTSCTTGSPKTCSSTSDQIITTPALPPPPALSNYAVKLILDQWPYAVQVSWDTDIPSVGTSYLTVPGMGTYTYPDPAGAVTHHSMILPVSPSTTYLTRIMSCNTTIPAQNQLCTQSTILEITTPGMQSPPAPRVFFTGDKATVAWSCDAKQTTGYAVLLPWYSQSESSTLGAPVISGISWMPAAPGLSYEGRVNWSTDINSDTTVEYGLDTNYGYTQHASYQEKGHQVEINNSAVNGKLKHFRVRSCTSDGKCTTSSDQLLNPAITFSGMTPVVTFLVAPNTTYTYNMYGTIWTGYGNGTANYWCQNMKVMNFTTPSANPPPVFDTTPSQTAYVGIPFSVQVHATDPDGTAVTYVATALPSGVTFNSTSATLTWTPTAADLGKTKSATIWATDGGQQSQSLTVNITAAPLPPPTVALTSPLAGQPYAGVLNFSASASVPDGIKQVEFYLQGQTTPFATDTTAPYAAAFDVSHYLTPTNLSGYAVAVSNSGLKTSSASVSFTVFGGTDTTPPVVSIISPKDGNPTAYPSVFKANITDNVGVASSRFYFDCTLPSIHYCPFTYVGAPYTLQLTYTNAFAPGSSHTLQVEAYDYAGNTTLSPVVHFWVN